MVAKAMQAKQELTDTLILWNTLITNQQELDVLEEVLSKHFQNK